MKRTEHFCDVCGKIVDDGDVRTVTDLMFPAFAIPVQYNREKLYVDLWKGYEER